MTQSAEKDEATVPGDRIVGCSCHMVSGVHDERVPREDAHVTPPEGERAMTVEKDALRIALNTPLESDERKRLAEKWADHYGHDGTIHAEIHTGCRFGSALRDDCCQPAVPRPIPPEKGDQ